MTQRLKIPPVFTPDNEPYLGLESVLWFDRIICWSMESNTKVARWTRQNSNILTGLQRAGCQIIPQGVSIALSIRELIRQAYLLSALILVRPLIERAAVVSYLDTHTAAVADWGRGSLRMKSTAKARRARRRRKGTIRDDFRCGVMGVECHSRLTYSKFMPITLDEIVEEARHLPADVVAELVDRIMLARHGGIESQVDTAWRAEIHSRVTEIDEGKVKGIPV